MKNTSTKQIYLKLAERVAKTYQLKAQSAIEGMVSSGITEWSISLYGRCAENANGRYNARSSRSLNPRRKLMAYGDILYLEIESPSQNVMDWDISLSDERVSHIENGEVYVWKTKTKFIDSIGFRKADGSNDYSYLFIPVACIKATKLKQAKAEDIVPLPGILRDEALQYFSDKAKVLNVNIKKCTLESIATIVSNYAIPMKAIRESSIKREYRIAKDAEREQSQDWKAPKRVTGVRYS